MPLNSLTLSRNALNPQQRERLNREYSYGHQVGASGVRDGWAGVPEAYARQLYKQPGDIVRFGELLYNLNPATNVLGQQPAGDAYLKAAEWVDEKLGTNYVDQMFKEIENRAGGPSLQRDLAQLAGMVTGIEDVVAPGVMAAAPFVAKGLGKFGDEVVQGMVKSPLDNQMGLIGYHGSPHRFYKFDHSMMGSGEGAQAYGWGTYIADKPEVAMTYADMGKFNKYAVQPDRAHIHAAKSWLDSGKTPSVDDLKSVYPDITEEQAKAAIVEAKGGYSPNLYEVDIPDEQVAKMLDWDAPLSERYKYAVNNWGNRADEIENLADAAESVPGVRASIKGSAHSGSKYIELTDDVTGKLVTIRVADHPQSGHAITLHGAADVEAIPGGDLKETLRDAMKLLAEDAGDETGADLYRFFTKVEGGERQASERLRDLGIPGIKYWDGSSRAAGEGTRNYVVFDEDLMTILKRNDEVISNFKPITDESVDGMRRYYSQRTWDSPEQAKEQIRKRIIRDNEGYTIGGPTNPDIVDNFEFVKSGKQYRIKQAPKKRAPVEIMDEPRAGASMPDVDFNKADMQDYGGTRTGYIDIDSLPKAKLAGGRTGYDWDEIKRGGTYPAPTIKLNKNGTVSIVDGNHRIEYWREMGMTDIPVKIIED